MIREHKYLTFPKTIGAAVAASLYLISFNRRRYVDKWVQTVCNKEIAGFFNKTATETGWQCSQNGEVLVTVGLKAGMIPTPIELTFLLLIAVVAWKTWKCRKWFDKIVQVLAEHNLWNPVQGVTNQ